MSRLSQITLDWADGEHTFRLRIKELIELDERCNAGPEFMRVALENGSYRANYARETVRLGLIGGGMEPSKALTLVKNYVDERPMQESVLIAEAILAAAIVGLPGDEPEKKPEAATVEPLLNVDA